MKASYESAVMRHNIQIDDLIHEARAAISRARYKSMWETRHANGHDNGTASLMCSIKNDAPAVVFGKDKTFVRHSSSGKNIDAGDVSTAAKANRARKGNEAVGSAKDDVGDDDPDDPDCPPRPKLAPAHRRSESDAPLHSASLLRLAQVLKIFPVSKSTWWAGVKTGRYPTPVNLSRKTTAWRLSDIIKLIDSLESAPGNNVDKGAAC